MRLFALTVLTMVAFAANSVLNRAALSVDLIGALPFGGVRLLAGAAALVALTFWLRGGMSIGGAGRAAGVLGLLLYIFGFSLAYQSLDAGAGALILFGTVQITMFGGALIGGTRPSLTSWIGAGLAFGGLAWLLWPSDAALSLPHAGAMLIAGFGWGVYSLAGRRASDAMQASAANFLLAAPAGLLLIAALPASPVAVTPSGIVLGVVSGAVTSGLGYALWYHVLPQLRVVTAAVAQLTVPVLATLGGMALLGEAVSLQFVLATALVFAGVGLTVLGR